jgi:hypothetical protein
MWQAASAVGAQRDPAPLTADASGRKDQLEQPFEHNRLYGMPV